jgi:hypothetical protein
MVQVLPLLFVLLSLEFMPRRRHLWSGGYGVGVGVGVTPNWFWSLFWRSFTHC